MKTARILLADSQVLLMEAVTKLLEPEFRVVGTVANSRELLRLAVETRPDMVVLDVSLSGLSGLEAGRQLKATLPAVKLIYLTLNEDGDLIDQAFRVGASAYLLKSCTAAELLAAVRGVWLHPSYRSPFVTRSKTVVGCVTRGQARQSNPLRLTLRQREVLQLLVAGRSMKEVAFALRIKPRTVAYHKYRMMQDFNLNSSAALVRFGLREQVA